MTKKDLEIIKSTIGVLAQQVYKNAKDIAILQKQNEASITEIGNALIRLQKKLDEIPSE